jgi:hypothetical protein
MTETERPVVKLTTPADLVGVVPWLVGFHPEESLVVMCLRGPRLRTGLTMRIDLPQPTDEEAVADELAARVRLDGAGSAFLVCYTAVADTEGGGLPRAAFVAALVEALDRRGIGCKDALLVRARRWHSYTCDLEECCPRSGRPLPERPTPAASRVAAEGVVSGRAPLSGRAELERSVLGPVGLRRGVADAACERAHRAAAVEVATDREAARTRTLALLGAALRSYEAGRPGLDVEAAARIAVGLLDRLTRDEVTTWVLDAPEAPLTALLGDLARATPDPLCAPVCTVLAWVAHAFGDGGLANVAVERALRHDPGYTMAQLVREGLDRQVAPRAVRQVSADVRRDLDRRRRLPSV